MKKTNFTNPRWISGWLMSLTFLAAFLFSVNYATSQCTLVANDLAYLSIDSGDCITEVDPDMILEAPQYCVGAIWQVIVYNMDGTPLHNPPDNIITEQEIGKTVLVQVMDLNSGNMTPKIPLVVLDKKAPYWVNLTNGDTLEMYCHQMEYFLPVAWDACDMYGIPEYWINLFNLQNEPDLGVRVAITNETEKTNPCLPGDDWPADTILRIVDRTYVAFDSSGNYSDPLSITILVKKLPDSFFSPNAGFFHMPLSRTVSGQNPISCADNFESTVDGCCEETGCPTPDFAGVPFIVLPNVINATLYLDTIELYPNGYLPCNISVSFLDLPFNSSNPGCVKSFKRFWTIRQWACGITDEMFYVQTIEIADNNDPMVECPPHEVITTNSIGEFPPTSFGEVDCAASYLFPVPEMSDSCAPKDALRWDIYVMNDMGIPVEFVDNADVHNPPYRLLPLGENTVRYTVYDPCGNSTSCEFTVSVEDHTAPVAVCQQFTTVGLTYDGQAEVFAHSFDSGSYDDCKVREILVRRMDWADLPCGLEEAHADEFKEYVRFCCADIGTPVMVQFRVYDIFNNYNECMVQVEVQDKMGPSIICPDTRTISCETPVDVNMTVEEANALFGTPIIHDNCENPVVTEKYNIDNLNQCGIGYVLRTITATDAGGKFAKCTQRIDFVNPNGVFWIDEANPNNPNDDVDWPKTYQGYGCMNPADLHPDVTGWPILHEGPCDLAGSTWKDDVFAFNDDNQDALDVCFKIIRHWKVIDWCQTDQYNNGVYKAWKYDQIIMVTDLEGPTITSDCEDKMACTYDCDGGYIELTMSATDYCTESEDLRWYYKIDYYNNNTNGSFDYESKVLYGANVQALGQNNGEFPIGTHRIYWTVWDQCGNKSTCAYNFTVMNCKAPTPYCLDHVVTTLMNMGNGEGMVQVFATECAPCCLESYHPCGYEVQVSFSADVNDTIRTFTCDDLGNNPIEVWATAVWPDGTPMVAFGDTLHDFCITKIEIQDNAGVCEGNTGQMVQVSGTINHYDGGPVSGVNVELEGSEMAPQITTEDGSYAFTALSNGSYSVIPVKDGDDTEGVTTLDLVLIQKHLLALKEMESPYALIAADVDNNDKVSAADLFTLRQLILGITDSFTKTDSWTFIDEAYQFTNPLNPFNEGWPQTYSMVNLNEDKVVDFVGIKMGDINNTVGMGGNDLENRNADALYLATEEQKFNRGEVVAIPVYADNFEYINGFQLTMNFNAEKLEFAEVEAGLLNVTLNNLGLTKVSEGKIAMSWSEANAVTAGSNEVLFTLYLNALESGKISESLSINNDITAIEAYNSDLEVIDLKMEIRNTEETGFVLYQNTPNPFSNLTAISFSLPEAGSATLTIQDVTGRVLKSISGNFNKGINTIQVKKSELDASGILYYQLDSEGNTATRKMVVIH